MQVNRSCIAGILALPDPLKYHIPKECNVFVLQEQQKQLIFLWRKLDRNATAHYQMRLRKHFDSPEFYNGIRLGIAAYHCIDPRQKLRDGEGLHDIILCTQAKPLYPVVNIPFAVRNMTGISMGRI